MSDESPEDNWSRAEVRQKAERLLARRGHSRSELSEKLVDREIPPALAERVCGELEEEGLLDDRAFARRQAELLREKNWGPRQIRHKLREHGVSEGDCDAALEEMTEGEWLEHCYARFAAKFGDDADALSRDEKGKAFRHLKRRGFEPWMARRVVLDGFVPESA